MPCRRRSRTPPWHRRARQYARDKHHRRRNFQRNADADVRQELIDRITAKLPTDWLGRFTLLETLQPPHLGSLNENIHKNTPISICTFGIENFERLGRGVMTVKQDIRIQANNDSRCYDLSEANRNKILNSLERNYPEICSDRYIVVVDCRKYHDPVFGKDSYHLGWKDETLAGLINNEEATRAIIDQILEGIKGPHGKNHRAKLANGLVIALMCKSGFHRSLASAKGVHHVLGPLHDDVKVFHLSQGDWSTRGCQKRGVGRCPLCQYQSTTQLNQLALALYQQNFDERVAAVLGLNDTILTLLDTAARAAGIDAHSTGASSSNVPPTVVNTPASKAMPKIVRPTLKRNTSKSSKDSGDDNRKIFEPKRSRSPPRPSSAPRFAYIEVSEHACGHHRALSAYAHKGNWLPQGKVVELIARSSVEWRGGTWNARLSELCMRTVEEANISFNADGSWIWMPSTCESAGLSLWVLEK